MPNFRNLPMKKTLQVLNGIAFVSTIFVNYLSNTGIMNGKTIGSISDNIKSLFTPAGYAFSIWGLIYLFLTGFIFYQGRSLVKKNIDDGFIEKISFWFIISCIANCAWIFSWVYEYTGTSCIFIFILLFAILKIILSNDMQINTTSKSKLIFLNLPFVVYGGWVTVASIANVSSFLVKIDWNGFGLSSETWTIIMIIIATLVNLIVVFKRNMYAFAFVGAWALIAIGVANQASQNSITLVTYIASALLIFYNAFRKFKATASF